MVMWVFGYASLVWKAGFDYDERIIGFIKGYRRAFHLACFEHRGTEKLPARVPTLEPDEKAVCWGVALCVKDDEAAQRAKSYLHVRESEYDVVKGMEFFTEDSPEKPVVSEVLVFMSTRDKASNRYYLGAAPRDTIAMQIATATGPSGTNYDYLFRLVDALRDIGHEDMEAIELASAVKRMLSANGTAEPFEQSPSPTKLLTIQSPVPYPPSIPSPVQMVSMKYSPRLVKSVAR